MTEPEIKVAAIVRPKDFRRHPLFSGCGRYSHAIVVSVDPFILVSRDTDMRWNKQLPENFEVIGSVALHLMKRYMRRLEQ